MDSVCACVCVCLISFVGSVLCGSVPVSVLILSIWLQPPTVAFAHPFVSLVNLFYRRRNVLTSTTSVVSFACT